MKISLPFVYFSREAFFSCLESVINSMDSLPTHLCMHWGDIVLILLRLYSFLFFHLGGSISFKKLHLIKVLVMTILSFSSNKVIINTKKHAYFIFFLTTYKSSRKYLFFIISIKIPIVVLSKVIKNNKNRFVLKTILVCDFNLILPNWQRIGNKVLIFFLIQFIFQLCVYSS